MSDTQLPATPPAAAVVTDGWTELRAVTAARIALGRTGASLPTQAVLEFELAHARARDAVHAPLDTATLRDSLQADGWKVLEAASRVPDRAAYLARPDWGRRLHADSAAALVRSAGTFDLAIVLADGLSALALQNHATPLLGALRSHLAGYRVAPLVIATQARVALADEAGCLLGAGVALSLIGERPGLSAADSLGAYLTYAPRVGRSDAERNCISNIRPGGLGFTEAAQQIAGLIGAMLAQGRSGVGLRLGADASAKTIAGSLL